MQTALTQRPTRLAVYAGKLAALAASTLAIVLATFALNAAVAGVIATVESRALDYPSAAELARGIGSGWLIMGMWCGLGALLGFAFRGVALPVGLGVVWVLGVEGLVSAVASSLLTSLQPLRDLLPGVNAGSLVWSLAPGGGSSGEAPPGVIDAVTGGRAALSLALYLAAFVATGAVLVRRRDVT
jgi:ABC-2 type transport system permease protein